MLHVGNSLIWLKLEDGRYQERIHCLKLGSKILKGKWRVEM